jgi:hypothetical protein
MSCFRLPNGLFGGGSASENHIYSGQHKLQSRLGQLAHSFSQLGPAEACFSSA